jgi:hypothetical protein
MNESVKPVENNAQEKSPSGRDGNGRFAKGNPGGPGNPYARRVAKLRHILLHVVREEDIQALMKKLLELATNGDVAAARLVLHYTLGKPPDGVHPDRVDIEDWHLTEEKSVQSQQMLKVWAGLPADKAQFVTDYVWPINMAKLGEAIRTGKLNDDDDDEDDEDDDEDEVAAGDAEWERRISREMEEFDRKAKKASPPLPAIVPEAGREGKPPSRNGGNGRK